MPQQQSPFLEGKYGWNYGESGWNTGMDENLLKFSFMFDRNVDGIVGALPGAVNGESYFLTTDNRLYFAVGTTWYSSPTPKWFEFKIKSTGDVYQFNGTAAVQIESPAGVDARLDAVELTLSTLGSAAFEDVTFFATQAELDIVEAQAQAYTDDLRTDLSDESQGAALVGFKQPGAGASNRTLLAKSQEVVSTSDGLSSLDSRAIAFASESPGFWEDDPSPGRLFRFTERAFFGDAATEGGGVKAPGVNKSWVGYSASGKMTYFESRATLASFSKIGGVAVSGASQSTDNVQIGELNTIGGGFFANNNNTNAADKKSAWAIYGHASQSASNQFTAAMELDICSLVPLTSISPYSMASSGATATAWLGVGGEVAQGLVAGGDTTTPKPVSCAVGIINSASTATENRYEKGIIFQANCLLGSDGVTGTATAIEMAKGHEITWRYSSGANAFGGKIRSDNTTASSQVRQVFSTAGLKFFGVNNDLATEVEIFRITPLPDAANFINVAPAITGGSPKLQSFGIDTNIDLILEPKGTGVVRFGNSTVAATTPANFSANRRLAIKDSTGTTYYIPISGVTW